MRALCFIVAGLLAVLTGRSVLAANCDGFTDVDSADSTYCSAVTYIKDKGITLGCTGTQYCPNNYVTRLQMALFLQRMGKGDSTNTSARRSAGARISRGQSAARRDGGSALTMCGRYELHTQPAGDRATRQRPTIADAARCAPRQGRHSRAGSHALGRTAALGEGQIYLLPDHQRPCRDGC
jgi:hypothetical protein